MKPTSLLTGLLFFLATFFGTTARGQQPKPDETNLQIQALTDGGITQSVLTAGWDQYDYYYSNINIKVAGTEKNIARLLRDHKVIWLDRFLFAEVRGERGYLSDQNLDLALAEIEKYTDLSDPAVKGSWKKAILLRVKLAAENRTIRNFVAQSHLFEKSKKSLEAYVMQWQLLPGTPKELRRVTIPARQREGFNFKGDAPISYLLIRPQQMEMGRAVIQYSGNPQAGDKILEIGYGSPDVMIGLGRLFDGTHFVGVDVVPIPADAVRPLRELNINLYRGNAPKDLATTQKIKTDGPYQAIYGVDTLLPSVAFDPKVTGADYAKFVFDNLADGGTAIFLNDYRRPLYFDRRDAEAAGFTKETGSIIEWDTLRELGPRSLKIVRHLNQDEIVKFPFMRDIGQMSIYVMRKGKMPVSRFE